MDKIEGRLNRAANQNEMDLLNKCLLHLEKEEPLCALQFNDSENEIYKLIDPRGKWGESTSGDIKYDIAKIRHSIVGGFDTITNGLYSAEYVNDNEIEYKVFKSKNNQIISTELDCNIEKNWKLDEIKMIEGLLFISMLPLHSDNVERQLAFFCVGIERLNEIFGI